MLLRRLMALVVTLMLACIAPSLAHQPPPAFASQTATNPIIATQPPSTILTPGTTSLPLTITTRSATTCAWSLNQDKLYAQMQRFAQGQNTTTHTTTISGITPDPLVVHTVYLRCASAPDSLTKLQYRVRAEVNPRFPRTGNLWGWWDNYEDKSPQELAKIDLWLGAPIPAATVKELRQINPDVIILDSTNAIENNDVPDSYFLRDVNGKKIEVWPNAYRLNMTRLEVAEYQARAAYQQMIDSGMIYDGMFFDNVMTSQSGLTEDIYGNPVQIDANEDGIADAPTVLDAAWKAGVFHEIQTFRKLMPGAIVNGHAMNIFEPGIAELFNGISIGFRTANVIEGEETFADVQRAYDAWYRDAKDPPITMVESSPIDDFAYGYGYEPEKLQENQLAFAKNYHPWMRFGLGFTLMNDGYFAHEWGDTWHGAPWWYEELDVDLGYPKGPAERVTLPGFDAGSSLLTNGGFESNLTDNWTFWTDANAGYNGTVTRDTTAYKEGGASARVNITATQGTDWRLSLSQSNRTIVKDQSYLVTFWAKADKARPVTLNMQKGAPNWDYYGLYEAVNLTTTWQQYRIPFTAPASASDASFQFMVGAQTGTVWFDDVQIIKAPPEVFKREFDNGLVVLNGTSQPQTVTIGPGYRRFLGTEASMIETVVDNASGAFSTPSGTWQEATYDSKEWVASGPYYHAWGENVRQGTGEARWKLPITATDTYTVSVWWPAAPAATGWNTAVTYDIVANGQVLASATHNQTTKGDMWNLVAKARIPAGTDAYLRLRCAGKPCVADAVYITSAARYNNGQSASSVTLQPYDAIVLVRETTSGSPVASRVLLPLVRR